MDDAQCDEICDFVMNHYVESSSGEFRLIYTKEKIRWAMCSPNHNKDLFYCVRDEKKKAIWGMIVGVPRQFMICGKKQKMAEINFLCVHAKLRDKRLAQIIISEMMRRCRIHKMPVQFYTSHHTKPTPFATNGYKLRFLNTQRLLDCGITRTNATESYKQTIAKYKLPLRNGIEIQGTTRLMEKKDAAQVFKLWNIQQEKYKFRYKMTQEEILYYLLPREGISYTWVIENPIDNPDGKKPKFEITDFYSVHM